MKISGSGKYKKRVRKALALIKQKSPQDWAFVKKLARISESKKPCGGYRGMSFSNKTFCMPANYIERSIPFIASTIVHDAWHLHQWESGLWRKRGCERNRRWCEHNALDKQIKALKRMGGSKHSIKYLTGCRYSNKNHEWKC